jgi:uncharacterized protein YqhQ
LPFQVVNGDVLMVQMNETKHITDESKHVEDESKHDKKETKKRSREKRLFAVIVIIVVSWLIVQIWAHVYDLFVRTVLKIPKKSFIPNLIVAIIVTVLIVWLVYAFDIDDMLGS